MNTQKLNWESHLRLFVWPIICQYTAYHWLFPVFLSVWQESKTPIDICSVYGTNQLQSQTLSSPVHEMSRVLENAY